jgi:two-component system sensor histidine kinase KdpD
LISRVTDRLASQLREHDLMIDVPADLPPVRLDAVHIEQVLTNVIENAAKYSPDGTPITIRSCLEDEPDGVTSLHISVADRGPGIEPSERSSIFEKFYRVTSSTRPVSGTGMGLAIVKGLVEAQGGHVIVESALGEGSTFTVVLPVERDEAEASLSGRESWSP